MIWRSACMLAPMIAAAVALAQKPPLLRMEAAERCRALQHHGKLNDARACFSELVRAPDPFLRAEGYLGLQEYEQANAEFREADRSHAGSAIVKTEWGRMFADHSQPSDAAKLFQEAIEADSSYAPAYLALARIMAESYDKTAIDLAHQALQRDPKLTEARELLAYLALEDNDPKTATQEARAALALSSEALDGMAILASIDWLDGKSESGWMNRILKLNPVYGEAYATGAHFFVINRRYEEGIRYYRKALDLNANLWAARSQLGINLMRLARDAEAKRQLEMCYAAHYRDAETVNALRFLDTLKDFEPFRTDHAEILLNKKEAALLRPYFEPVLQRAIITYQRKYRMNLPGPVRLEVFPNHEDFVVRTLGLPGQGGLLGVTFGTVVAMDSPSAHAPGQFNWASTMWHELSHVYVLTATSGLVPRWFAEGLAVHEQATASPDWGDAVTPDIIAALQQKKLLPVLQLDRGFVRPEYPGQVLVSYYEAGKICDYIVQKSGDEAILDMIHSYANRKTTAEAIQDNLHQSADGFDKGFSAWLDATTANTVRHFDDWKQGTKIAYEELKSGRTSDAIRQARTVRDYFPDYVGPESSYELMSQAYLQTGNKANAMQTLEKYRDLGGTDVELLKKLAQIERESGNVPQAQTTLEEINFIYPEDEEVHRSLGALLLQTGDTPGAIREFRAVIVLQPADLAESHYNLARALSAAHKFNEAKDEVLVALEAAPDFKPAQQLLLQLNQ